MLFNKIKKRLFLITLVFTILFSSPLAAQSQNQNFPNGSSQGTTEMNQNVRGMRVWALGLDWMISIVEALESKS